jgi:putative transposase
MKTLEFKLTLSKAQKETLNSWMTANKWVWNEGVRHIEWFNEFNKYHKPDKKSYPCSPIRSQNFWKKFRGQEPLQGCSIGEFPSCPIGWINDSFDPALLSFAVSRSPNHEKIHNISVFSFVKLFALMRHTDKPWLCAVPSKFVAGEVACLINSWEAFTKSPLSFGRRPPKYKGKHNHVEALIHNNSKGIGTKGDSINIPKLGYIRVKGFTDRWYFEDGKPIDFCPMKIIKKASGWYLQISGNIPERKYHNATSIAGFDMGVHEILTDDQNYHVASPRYLKASQNSLKRLQRKMSRQFRMNEKDKMWQRKNWTKTKSKLAKVHEKIARQRRAINHYLSHKAVNTHAVIAIEDLKLTNMTKAVKTGESGVQNGRKAKSGLNRAMLDNGLGQLVNMIETKAKVANRIVVRVNPSHTSQECPTCGHIEKKPNRKNRNVTCSNCGATFHRDVSAAIIIKRRGIARLEGCENVVKEKRERKSRYSKRFKPVIAVEASPPIVDKALYELPLFNAFIN